MESKSQLCWECKNACGGCSWSDGTFTPVEGWDAKTTQIVREGKKAMPSYQVISCPKFDPDDVMIPLTKLPTKLSIETLYLRIKRGDLKAEMIDHKWYVREHDWKEFEKNYRRWSR